MTFATKPRGGALVGALWMLTFASAPALADEPSPASIALATTLLTDVGLKQSVDIIVPSMLAQLEHSVVGLHPEMQAPLHEVVTAATPDFMKTEAGVIADLAHVVATRMSEQEIKDTIAFFESAAGKKYVATQGPILQELSASGTAWRQKLSTDMLARVREDMKKKGFDF